MIVASTSSSSSSNIKGDSAAYDRFSSSYDELDGGEATELLGINKMRKLASNYVRGNVLETAVGTGLQTQFYDWDKIVKYTGVDISEGMLSQARQRLGDRNIDNTKIDLAVADVTKKLAFGDNQFDVVVDTFSLCVIDDPLSALKEMARVTKEEGVVVLLENSISTNPLLARLQDFTEPLITPMSKGCRWNVDVPALAAKAGLAERTSMSIQGGTILLETLTKTK
jgi:ubiquinone/menaquinone biosynthesis C-methylase UbiE